MKATQRLFVALLGVWLLLRLPVALAIDTTPPLPDPVLQQRYLGLTHELRCMQCQDESLADSPVAIVTPCGALWEPAETTAVDFAAMAAMPGVFGLSGDLAGLPDETRLTLGSPGEIPGQTERRPLSAPI